MKLKNLKIILLLLCGIFFESCHAAVNPNPLFIRASQVGYLPDDIKVGVVFSMTPVYEKSFSIKSLRGDEVFSHKIVDSSFEYDKFKYCYQIDYSSVKEPGRYQIEVDGQRSFPFEIGANVFNRVVDSLMLFLKVQRCGPTNPLLHKVCHLSDVARMTGGNSSKGVDVTGGWHDAGDYIKFISTTAYTTYMLLFAYEFDKKKFGFDNDKNGVPDLLEEARVGLDWLLRCEYSDELLVTQVQDLRDHEVGWRLPENDTLRFDRVGIAGIGKNQIGLYSAVLSLASRIWHNQSYDEDFAVKCLRTAEKYYRLRDNVQNIDISSSGFYQDQVFWGKLALGAIELYNSTKNEDYLSDARIYADSAGSDYWWSWGNINSLAHYRLAKIYPSYKSYIYNNLSAFNTNKDSSVFREAMAYSWGTTNSLLGASLQVILYNDLTKTGEFDSLATFQRDYVLGRNPWGLSFIYNIGKIYPKNLHSQISHFTDGYLPGALTAGPAPVGVLRSYQIERTNSRYSFFNTDSIKYYDDRLDYITNEPTITGNATAIFVYGFYSNR